MNVSVRALALVPALLLLAGCDLPTAKQSASSVSAATDAPKVAALSNAQSRPIKLELNKRLEAATRVFHAGCRDAEKASCKLSDRVCGKGAERAIVRALAKGPAIVEWEAPRTTWEENAGVLSHYWFVNKDGSGTYYYLLPSPDDVQTDCGEGKYCGWHKEELAAGTLFAKAELHLTPARGTEIADLDHCPEPPPQPSYY